MSTKIVIIFPYNGFEAESDRERLFWCLVSEITTSTPDRILTIILNSDTEIRGQTKAFFDVLNRTGTEKTATTVKQDLLEKRLKQKINSEKALLPDMDSLSNVQLMILRTWAVDTCQMWLSGWGAILDEESAEETDRIILLPGDLEQVEEKSFFINLTDFIHRPKADIDIGDFDTINVRSAKHLIDQYGTYALLANWFPNVSDAIFNKPLSLKRPRSEFLNIKRSTLAQLLTYKKFAYEQTLNMIIHSWNHDNNTWKHRLFGHPLGILRDEGREFNEAINQIERTERMLKCVWREIKANEINAKAIGSRQIEFRKILDEYFSLDRKSTSIREAAYITVLSLLAE